MATAVSVMDGDSWDARTDVVVLVDPPERRLLWIPRDLWCECVRNRINAAFRCGGHELLLAALAEHGLGATGSICLCRGATERALASVTVAVPVERRLEFWYPLEPTGRTEDGRKLVLFEPPQERLGGERLHQWLGARKVPGGTQSDLPRLTRQQTLVRRLLEEGFPFAEILEDDGDGISIIGDNALADLAQVRADWRFATLSDGRPMTLQGCQVLVRGGRLYRWGLRIRRPLA